MISKQGKPLKELMVDTARFMSDYKKMLFPYFIFLWFSSNIALFATKFLGVIPHTNYHFIFIVLETFIYLYFTVTLIVRVVDIIEGKDQGVLGSLAEGFWAAPGYFLYSLLAALVIMLGLVLLVVPGLYFILVFSFVPMISVMEPGAKSYFKRSKELAKRNIKVLTFSVVLAILLMGLAVGVTLLLANKVPLLLNEFLNSVPIELFSMYTIIYMILFLIDVKNIDKQEVPPCLPAE